MARSAQDEAMKRAMVSDLKLHLSAYLAEVRRGASVIVCDRATPIARLVPYDDEERDGFEVVAASRPVTDLAKVRRVRPKRGIDVVRLLREDRDAR
jgi:prevent-host-death family protein